VKTMCGSDESHPHSVTCFTHRIEQVREDDVQRVIVYGRYNVTLRRVRVTIVAVEKH